MTTATLPRESATQSEQVARSAGAASLAIGISRLTGLVREMVMAHKFGAGLSYDAFLLGFRIPNLSRDLVAEGALSSAFVPVFTTALETGSPEEARALANVIGTATILVVSLLCALGMILAPQLVMLLAPGYAMVQGKLALAVHLTRVMFPFLLLIALAAQATGMLNTCGRFGVPALASTCFNLGAIGFGLALGFWIGPYIGIRPIEGMAYGIVIGGALQLAWQIPVLRAYGFRFRFSLNWSHPGLRRVFGLMIPALLGNAAVQINIIVNTSFASRLADPLRGHDGPVSWLGYALRFVQLPLGLFGVAFASAMLPSVARSAVASNFEEFRKTVSRSLSMVFLLTIPSSVVLILLGRPIIGAIYQSGRFQAYDTQQTALALACYSFGLLAYASVKILNPAFYALSNARIPMYASLLSIAINILLPLFLLNTLHFGFAALALTTSFAVTLESLALFECLRRKLGGIEGRYLFDRFVRITAASLLMALAIAWANHEVTDHLGTGRWTYLSELMLCLPLGFAVFAIGLQLFGVEDMAFATDVFLGPIRAGLLAAHAKIRS